MRLSRKRVFFSNAVAAALVLACRDSTAPAMAEFYFLESVNGQPVPAVLNADPGDTTTVLWASFALDGLGKAVTATHIRRVSSTTPPFEATYSLRWSYRIIGDSVAFHETTLCPANALCVGPPVGKFVDGKLMIHDPYPSAPVYLYFRAGPID